MAQKKNNSQSTSKPGPTGRTRHSKSAKKPVTIDLKAEDASKASQSVRKPAGAADSGKPDAAKTVSAKKSVPPVKAKAKSNASAKNEPAKDETTSSVTRAATAPAGPAASASAVKSDNDAGSKGTDDKTSTDPKSKTPETASKAAPVSSGPRPSSAPEKKQGNGWSGRLIAAVIGGFVALGGGYVLQSFGVLSSPGAMDREVVSQGELNVLQSNLEDRIAALENAEPVSAPSQQDLTRLIDERVQEQAAALSVGEGSGARAADIVNRLTALETELASVRESADALTQDAGSADADSVLSSRLDELALAVEQIRGVSAAESDSSGSSPDGQIADRIAGLEDSVSSLRESVSQQISDAAASIAETGSKLSALQDKTTELADGLAGSKERVAALAEDVSANNNLLSQLREKVENGASKKAAAAIAAAALKRDIDAGRPFDESLETLKSFAPDLVGLQRLDALSATGVPNTAELAARFSDPVSDRILAAAAESDGGGVGSRLMSGVKSLVKIRPLTPIEGDDPAALVSQIDAHMQDGELQQAAEKWVALPESAKSVSSDWHAQLQGRIVANDVLDGTLQSFLNSNREG